MNTVLRLLKLAFSQKETASLRGFQSKMPENRVQVLLVWLRQKKTKPLRQKKRERKSLRRESEEKETVEKKKEVI